MKRLILLLTFVWAGTFLMAQDFTISGYVTNANGNAINNFQVCVNTPASSNNPFTGCVFTNPNGCDSTLIVDTVMNNQGTINSATVNFVYCQQTMNCNAMFTTQISGLNVHFVSANTSNLVHHFWDFGNGISSTLANPTQSYVTAGTYTVMHVVWNTSCADTVWQTIVVGNTTNCTAAFTYQTSGLTLSLTPTMANTLATYTWSFGDGTSST